MCERTLLRWGQQPLSRSASTYLATLPDSSSGSRWRTSHSSKRARPSSKAFCTQATNSSSLCSSRSAPIRSFPSSVLTPLSATMIPTLSSSRYGSSQSHPRDVVYLPAYAENPSRETLAVTQGPLDIVHTDAEGICDLLGRLLFGYAHSPDRGLERGQAYARLTGGPPEPVSSDRLL